MEVGGVDEECRAEREADAWDFEGCDEQRRKADISPRVHT